MDEQQRERVALFRYAAIGELVNGPLAPGDTEKVLTRLSQKEWTIPGTDRTRVGRATLRDWMAAYRAMGLEGLKPQPRSDAGSSRAIPATVQELLLAMRKERPKASLESLVRAMRLSGKVPADLRLAPSTVHRVLAAHGVPAASAGTPEPDARAFTFPHANDLWTSDVMHGPRLLVRTSSLRPLPRQFLRNSRLPPSRRAGYPGAPRARSSSRQACGVRTSSGSSNLRRTASLMKAAGSMSRSLQVSTTE